MNYFDSLESFHVFGLSHEHDIVVASQEIRLLNSLRMFWDYSAIRNYLFWITIELNCDGRT